MIAALLLAQASAIHPSPRVIAEIDRLYDLPIARKYRAEWRAVRDASTGPLARIDPKAGTMCPVIEVPPASSVILDVRGERIVWWQLHFQDTMSGDRAWPATHLDHVAREAVRQLGFAREYRYGVRNDLGEGAYGYFVRRKVAGRLVADRIHIHVGEKDGEFHGFIRASPLRIGREATSRGLPANDLRDLALAFLFERARNVGKSQITVEESEIDAPDERIHWWSNELPTFWKPEANGIPVHTVLLDAVGVRLDARDGHPLEMKDLRQWLGGPVGRLVPRRPPVAVPTRLTLGGASGTLTPSGESRTEPGGDLIPLVVDGDAFDARCDGATLWISALSKDHGTSAIVYRGYRPSPPLRRALAGRARRLRTLMRTARIAGD